MQFFLSLETRMSRMGYKLKIVNIYLGQFRVDYEN